LLGLARKTGQTAYSVCDSKKENAAIKTAAFFCPNDLVAIRYGAGVGAGGGVGAGRGAGGGAEGST